MKIDWVVSNMNVMNLLLISYRFYQLINVFFKVHPNINAFKENLSKINDDLLHSFSI